MVSKRKKPSRRFLSLNSIPDIKEAVSAPPSTGKQWNSLNRSTLPVRLKKKKDVGILPESLTKTPKCNSDKVVKSW